MLQLGQRRLTLPEESATCALSVEAHSALLQRTMITCFALAMSACRSACGLSCSFSLPLGAGSSSSL